VLASVWGVARSGLVLVWERAMVVGQAYTLTACLPYCSRSGRTVDAYRSQRRLLWLIRDGMNIPIPSSLDVSLPF
jgi:hypothetical protein